MLEARISPAYRERVLTASSHPNASNRTKCDNKCDNEQNRILMILLSYLRDPLDCVLIGDQKARSYIHACIIITQVEVCVWTPPRLLIKLICLHLQNSDLSLSLNVKLELLGNDLAAMQCGSNIKRVQFQLISM